MATRANLAAEPTLRNQHEKELVERAQAGDAEAFGQLYETLADAIYRYIFFRVSDGSVAEDLTSQVFLKAWEHLPHYRPQAATILAWIYTIARNTVIDFYRVQHPTDALDEIETISSHEPSPHEECELHLESEALQHAPGSLTGEQREVIIMRLIDGMSTDEIAGRLGKRPGAIRAAQMRGLQALARVLKDEPSLPAQLKPARET